MAITKQQKETFIELRAEGKSFDTIAKEMKISKPTLIKLEYQLKDEITNAEFIMYQAIIEKYKLSKNQRIESFSRQLEKINKELDTRDYSNYSFRDLINAKINLLAGLRKELENVELLTGVVEDYWDQSKRDEQTKYKLD